MLGLIIFVAITSLVGIAVVLGWSVDTREPGRRWYPGCPDSRC